jgi:hypothetical protein
MYIEDKKGNIIQWPTKEDHTKGHIIYIYIYMQKL